MLVLYALQRLEEPYQGGWAPDQPQCPVCDARVIAVIKPYDEKIYLAMKKQNKNTEEREAEARILNTFSTGDNFYREILKAERKFVQMHRFWSD